jgi:RNA-directed DNA polymerase
MECPYKRIEQGTYEPSSVRRVEIPKPNGGTRLLGIPTVTDCFIQQAMVLSQVCEPLFSKHSYGFRPNRRGRYAVKKAKGYIQEGYRYVVDLEKFFDRVLHDRLITKRAEQVTDKQVLSLMRKYLRAGVMEGGLVKPSEEGTPQGGPLSPLLSNIVLHELDHELKRREHRFVRYADDCNIYVKTEKAGVRVMASVTRFIEGKLKLKVNHAKSAVDRPWKRKFLGCSFTVDKVPRVRVSKQAIDKAKTRIRKRTSRKSPMNMEQRIQKLHRDLVGWSSYFLLADTPRIFEGLDGWMRRRLRMYMWKQWKNPRTNVKRLQSLGIPKGKAYEWGNSRKGYWRIAGSPILSRALNNKHWKESGLQSLLERYKNMR